MIGLVTDSASQITPDLVRRYGVEVVPVTVTVDGTEYAEGIDLDADGFWARFSGGREPEVKTSQPSPGALAAVYRRLIGRGVDQILSIHVGTTHSGTVNSALLAAETVDAEVLVVDSGTASFGVACCVWAAGELLAEGAGAADAAARAAAVASQVGTAFIVQALEFAQRGGRVDESLIHSGDGVAVIAGRGGDLEVIGTGRTVDELCDLMVEPFLESGTDIRAGVSLADSATLPFTEGIEARLEAAPVAVDQIRYRVGPSIAAHTGPGTAGGFWFSAQG